jgi:coenzyme F420 hydrogenase subunit beta
MSKPNIIEKIVKSDLCSGCGLCAGIAPEKISMNVDANGYLRPVVHGVLNEGQDKILSESCPGSQLQHFPSSVKYHPLWGPIISSRTGYANDQEIRHTASSGGGISSFLLYLLESGKIDYVVQTAVSTSDPILNKYQISKSRSDILRAAGSRYAPSAPLEAISDLLDQPGKFAFVGKPCDVAALRQLARHDIRVKQKVTHMIAFMCAGVPSFIGTDNVLKHLGVARDRLESFRYRGNGWPGYASARTIDGEEKSMDYATSWGTILNKHLQLRCKICADGVGEFADIVCADAWYGKDGYPDFAEQDGRSLILTRTAIGEQLVIDAQAAGYVTAQDLAIAEIEKMQPYQANRKRLLYSRLSGMKLVGAKTPRYLGFGLFKLAFSAGFRANIKSMIGTARRLLRYEG